MILKTLKNFFEDQRNTTEPLFEIYCKGNNLPLAMLAINEGGLPNAIGRIQTAQKGYINWGKKLYDDYLVYLYSEIKSKIDELCSGQLYINFIRNQVF